MTLEWKGGAFNEANLFANGVAVLAEDKENLLGTQRTLDGKCALSDTLATMEKGLLSRRGVTVVDDTATPLFTENGWVAERPPREKGSYRDLVVFAYGHDYKECLGAFPCRPDGRSATGGAATGYTATGKCATLCEK